MLFKRLLPALFLLLALPAAGQDRALFWKRIDVNAHLDARGTLHVRERQTFVFTGPWNGGERVFRVGLNQDLELEGIYRIGPDGREIPLVEGDLDQMDHYKWTSSDTVRWRSRMESDPPFDQTAIPYVIAYRVTKILTEKDGVYHLSHDFSLPKAEWPIETLAVDLDLDPAWQPLDKVPSRFERRNLQPGSEAIVRARLKHTGAASVETGVKVPPAPLRRGLFAASLVVMAALYFRFRTAEGRRGRFEPLPEASWDEAWLQENVFDLKPEEVGALWDQAVGPPEVAAVLARMVAEGKMTSEVRPGRKLLGFSLSPDVLHLRLNVPRNTLAGYERELVDKLFLGGDETDTDSVKQYYRSTGFNPASLIEKPLRAAVSSHGQLGSQVPPPSRRPTLYLALAALVLFGLAAVSSSLVATAVLLAIVLFLVLWPTLVGQIAAFAWRKRSAHLDAASLIFLIPGLIVLGICAAAAFLRDWAPASDLAQGLFGTLGLAVLPLAVWNSLLNNARSRESDGTIRKRRLLTSARRLLEKELSSAHPRLRDEWLPYLLAFGLGSNVDRWFRSFGGPSSRGAFSAGTMSTGGSSSSGGSIGGGWSGGGGSFGGAGATGAWAVAAAGLASGVSAPSSSSSGGGGGGGGSSSGGGGGGGW
jgi:uncharacterized membrane protein YgcG